MIPLYIFFASIYVFRFFFFLLGNLKSDYIVNKHFNSTTENDKFVSIIVPARNEENTITNCVVSIMKSSFPQTQFEVIVVDDRSTDSTYEILTTLLNQYPNLKIVKISDDSEKNGIPGKPGALHVGIQSAKGDIILMTDADCTVHSRWIESMTNSFLENELIGMVASFTLINEHTFFHKMQAIEWIQAHTLARGGVNMNSPIGCFGNNIAVRKKAYEDLGGYERIPFSVTEDLALLQAMAKSTWSIRYICNEFATVSTEPEYTISGFLKQHKRWAVGGLSLKWKAALLITYSASMWIAVILASINLDFLWLGILIGIKFLTDFLLVNVSFNRLNSRHNTWFLVGEVFMILVEIVVPFLMISKTVHWKGQTFKKS